MGRRQILKQQLIEDVHITLKKENRARAVNKRTSEILISKQEREMKALQRKASKDIFETYQEISTEFNLLNTEREEND